MPQLDLTCPVCHSLIIAPTFCAECLNCFCYKCIIKRKIISNTCPHCYQTFRYAPCPPMIMKYLIELEVICENLDCKRNIKYIDYPLHKETCNVIEFEKVGPQESIMLSYEESEISSESNIPSPIDNVIQSNSSSLISDFEYVQSPSFGITKQFTISGAVGVKMWELWKITNPLSIQNIMTPTFGGLIKISK